VIFADVAVVVPTWPRCREVNESRRQGSSEEEGMTMRAWLVPRLLFEGRFVKPEPA
jgi:hypothetical protein